MASFIDHITKAKSNLSFLAVINKAQAACWDWQVTVCFYTAVHLVNSHLAKKSNLHYKTHDKVKNALFEQMSVCRLTDQQDYLAYAKLESLSRRARYLCNNLQQQGDNNEMAFFTHEVHLSKALSHLERVLLFIEKEYGERFSPIGMDCTELKGKTLSHFQYKQKAQQQDAA